MEPSPNPSPAFSVEIVHKNPLRYVIRRGETRVEAGEVKEEGDIVLIVQGFSASEGHYYFACMRCSTTKEVVKDCAHIHRVQEFRRGAGFSDPT